MADERFLGTWQLVAVEREDLDTGAKIVEVVKQTGYISYAPDGRMMVIISRLYPDGNEDVVCYAAQWQVDGASVVHDIDVSGIAPWKGTKQVREYRFEGNRLTLSHLTGEDLVDGRNTRANLVWERVQKR